MIHFVQPRDLLKMASFIMSKHCYLAVMRLLLIALIVAFSGQRMMSAGFSNLGWIGFLQKETEAEHHVIWSYAAHDTSTDEELIATFKIANSLALNSSAYLGLGYVQARNKALMPAIQSIEDAIQAGREDPVTYLFLGNLAQQAGDEALAVSAWRLAHAERYFETRSQIALAAGDKKAALALNLRATEINPQTDLAYLGLGQYYYETAQFTQAVEAFETRARTHQDRIGYSWLGRAAEAQGDFNKAREAYEKAAELGELWYGYVALGDLYFRQGDLAAAQEWYQRGEVAFPTSLSIKLKLGNLALHQADLRAAYVYFSDALESAPEHPWVSYYMGVWYYAQRNYEMARSWFEQALSLGLQADNSFYEVLLDSYLKTGDCKSVQQMVQHIQEDQSLSDQQRSALRHRAASCVDD